MGVKACYRKNCENIMCDRYSSEHGYICYECISEAKDLLLADGQVDLKAFMRTPKKPPSTVCTSEAEIDQIFKEY